MNHPEIRAKIANLQQKDNSAELKFVISLRSRLIEEGVDREHSAFIATVVRPNLDGISEDDDFINEMAVFLAEIIYRDYFFLYNNGFKFYPAAIESFFRNRYDI